MNPLIYPWTIPWRMTKWGVNLALDLAFGPADTDDDYISRTAPGISLNEWMQQQA